MISIIYKKTHLSITKNLQTQKIELKRLLLLKMTIFVRDHCNSV